MPCSAGGPKSCWAMPNLETVRAARLRRTLVAVAAAHLFYRSHFRELCLAPADIRSLDDLGRSRIQATRSRGGSCRSGRRGKVVNILT